MSDYYDELAGLNDLAMVDGWRHQLEQWLRFEAVVRGLRIDDEASVVDLGCGTGRLFEYLGKDRAGKYVGVDRLESSIETAGATLPQGRFLNADFGDSSVDEAGPFDFAVAVGTLVDGSSWDRAGRMRALELLVNRLDELGQKGFALVILDQQRLEADPVRRLEESLQGASKAELDLCLGRRQVDALIDDGVLPSDLFVLVRRDEASAKIEERIAGELAHEAVVRRYRQGAEEVDKADLAWLWLVAGRHERAREIVDELPTTNRRKTLLAQRLSMLG